MATIRDVAKQAGVSVGTVSNVLNRNSVVREETRSRVLEAIEALNFHPTAAARSLNTQRTNTIGMVRTELRPNTPHIVSDPFVLDLIDGISAAAIDSSTGLTFWTIPLGPEEMALYKRLVLGRQVDGLILFAARRDDPRIAYLTQADFPFVVFGHNGMDDTNWIDVDGAVDFFDFAYFASCWLAEEDCIEDLDGNGSVDFEDLYEFSDNWLWEE